MHALRNQQNGAEGNTRPRWSHASTQHVMEVVYTLYVNYVQVDVDVCYRYLVLYYG